MNQNVNVTKRTSIVDNLCLLYCSSINGTQSKYDAAINHQRALQIKFRDHSVVERFDCTAKIEIRPCVEWSLTKGIRQREIILKIVSRKRTVLVDYAGLLFTRDSKSKSMCMADGIVMRGRVLLAAAAAEPWGNLTCSQSSRGSTAKKTTAS